MRVFYKFIVGIWIFLGLSWLSMVLNLAGDFMKAQTKKVDQDLGKEKPKNENKSVGFVHLHCFVQFFVHILVTVLYVITYFKLFGTRAAVLFL